MPRRFYWQYGPVLCPIGCNLQDIYGHIKKDKGKNNGGDKFTVVMQAFERIFSNASSHGGETVKILMTEMYGFYVELKAE